LAFISLGFFFAAAASLDISFGQQVLLKSDFDNAAQADNPWSGVNGQGLLSVLPGQQLTVDDTGNIAKTVLSPSVAVGDLNGDGLQDLVIGDSRGFFWYFPNSGTPTEPKFTHGEIMPIWLGFPFGDPLFLGPEGADNVIPRIQLVDLEEDKKVLSLVVGNYVGRLFYLQNQGSPEQPSFRMPEDRDLLIVPTKKHGELWCNYIAPFLYDWFGTGKLDLIMGDGSYSANSIYLFKNQNERDKPNFNQDGMTKIIPGMGREHLTPQVVDWNNDGKPDIIAGERTGHLNIFLNTSTDPTQPTFDAGNHVTMGGQDTFGDFATVTVCDLWGNKLPNLIITNASGAILDARNTGKLGAPQFDSPVPIRGVNPFPSIMRPAGWRLISPAGVPHELLVTTNKSVQPNFIPPPNTNFTSALRYYVYPVQNTYFKTFYYPSNEGVEPHSIICDTPLRMKEKQRYKISFLIRTTGNVHDLSYVVRGFAHYPDTSIEEVIMKNSIGTGDSWYQFEDSLRFRLQNESVPDMVVDCGLSLEFFGQGEVYLDDVQVVSEE
jgi:hypothetical protein